MENLPQMSKYWKSSFENQCTINVFDILIIKFMTNQLELDASNLVIRLKCHLTENYRLINWAKNSTLKNACFSTLFNLAHLLVTLKTHKPVIDLTANVIL